jgi:competence protein ComEC
MRLFWLGSLWLAGIALGRVTPLATSQWLILAGASLLCTLLFWRLAPSRSLFIAVCLLSLGAARYQSSQRPLEADHVAHYNDRDQKVHLTGLVVRTPDVRDAYTGLHIEVEELRPAGAARSYPARGRILLRAPRAETWAYGDRLYVAGYLETPPTFETFSYQEYLARQGIHSIMQNAYMERLAAGQGNPLLQIIFDFRAHALDLVYRLFPDPEASLLAGILLGIESGISPQVREAFNATGTTHIIAISGFNITIVAGLFTTLFGRWFGARIGSISAALAIGVYTLLVGADAAVVRAALMAGLALLALRLGRQTHGMASLAAAAMAMTLFDPRYLWDVGFQLSFMATLGLVLYAESMRTWLVGRLSRRLSEEQAEGLAGPVSEFMLFTLAAQITTFPITAFHFQRLSLTSLIANPVILPVQPPVMILGGLATLSAALWFPLGELLSWIAWPFAAFTIRAVEFFARLPSASIPLGSFSFLTTAGIYALLFGGTALVSALQAGHPSIQPIEKLRQRISIPVHVGLAGLVALTAFAWRLSVQTPDGRLHVTILDVGEGDAVLIQSPTGRFVLVDGGASAVALSEALGRRLPLGQRSLDWLVISGTRETQIAGLIGNLERFPPRSVLIAGPPGGGPYRRLIHDIAQAAIPVHHASAGHTLELGRGAELEVTGVGAQGAVLTLRYEHAHVVLAAGADPELVQRLIGRRAPAKAHALLLTDGGYAAVNPPDWLAQVDPWVAMISVQAGDRRGLPPPETLDNLAGRTVLRTDLHGWIELTTDGEHLWAERERDPTHVPGEGS